MCPQGRVNCSTDKGIIPPHYRIVKHFSLTILTNTINIEGMKTWKQQKTTLTIQMFARVTPALHERVKLAADKHFNGKLSDLVRWAIEGALMKLEETDGQTESIS